jgi:hypothetical protein
MALSWNEIEKRAITFSKEWEDVISEDAEAKSFLDGFFNVFGVNRRRVATFETKVHKTGARQGFIDLLWRGQILIEMKSRGKNLDRAYDQARGYFAGLPDYDLPKYIMVCDFESIRLYNLDNDTTHDIKLNTLFENVRLFGFIAGYLDREIREEDPVNIEAAVLMGKLHDALKATGYSGHKLELYLVRLLFCLFADDTTIFEKGTFQDFIERKTREDGSDLGAMLNAFFEVLNIDNQDRLKTLDADLNAFPYINGKLFEERLPTAAFTSDTRRILLDSCGLNWGLISPAIFGSMFQSVMDEKARRNFGAHYTSEKNILKLIRPLFLDELWAEFEKVKLRKTDLLRFHKKLSDLRFLDPACGCGNFLVITYRELRLLEMEVVKRIVGNQLISNVGDYFTINIDKFYGIEYDEFPAQIAQVAMWLTDHQMNLLASQKFGDYFKRIPLKKTAVIYQGNALRIDWGDLIKKDHLNPEAGLPENTVSEPETYYKTKVAERAKEQYFDFIIGNPPFVGKQLQNTEQKADMARVWGNVKGAGVLDYVACWHLRAAQYVQKFNTKDRKIKCALVSTNSIAQGEQPGILWNELFNRYHIKIHFAHQTFSWSNEASGNAAVHCIIIGFSNFDIADKHIFEYDDIKGDSVVIKANNISPYLVEGKDYSLMKRSKPISKSPEILFGSMPNDGGNLLLTNEEKNELVTIEPLAEKYIKPLIGAYEFLNGGSRWCLWLKGISPIELRQLKEVNKRVEKVKSHRLKSDRETTRLLADYPTLFGEDRQPTSEFIVMPRVSSENRKYIPIGFFAPTNIVGDTCLTIPNATLYHFGMLTSLMHMAWVKFTCGRLESRYRYSNTIVYNNYPWPENPSEKQIKAVETAAQVVLDARVQFTDSSLADLYNTIMPPALVKAHQALDKAVDQCYRPQPFTTDAKRVEFLFDLYDKYTANLFTKEKPKRASKKATI